MNSLQGRSCPMSRHCETADSAADDGPSGGLEEARTSGKIPCVKGAQPQCHKLKLSQMAQVLIGGRFGMPTRSWPTRRAATLAANISGAFQSVKRLVK